MDYTRPNHIPTAHELATQTRQETQWLLAFAAVMVVITVGAALLFGSRIA